MRRSIIALSRFCFVLTIEPFVLSGFDSSDEHEIAKQAQKSRKDNKRPSAGYRGNVLVLRNGKIEGRR